MKKIIYFALVILLSQITFDSALGAVNAILQPPPDGGTQPPPDGGTQPPPDGSAPPPPPPEEPPPPGAVGPGNTAPTPTPTPLAPPPPVCGDGNLDSGEECETSSDCEDLGPNFIRNCSGCQCGYIQITDSGIGG